MYLCVCKYVQYTTRIALFSKDCFFSGHSSAQKNEYQSGVFSSNQLSVCYRHNLFYYTAVLQYQEGWKKWGKFIFQTFYTSIFNHALIVISYSTVHQYKYCKYRSIESIANEMYICIIFVCMLQNRCFFLYQKQVNIRAELSWAGNRRNTSPSVSSQTTGAAPELRDDGTRHRRGNGGCYGRLQSTRYTSTAALDCPAEPTICRATMSKFRGIERTSEFSFHLVCLLI